MKKNVYGGFSQALFFSNSISIPRFLLDYYCELGISNDELLLIIHLLAESNKQDVADGFEEKIIAKMNITDKDFKKMVLDLKKRNLLSINNNKDNVFPKGFKYDFSGLIDQLFELWGIYQFKQMEATGRKKGEDSLNAEKEASLKQLTAVFEDELGRPLTGFECEHIKKWLLASYSEELIMEALRRGVSAGVRSFRYLDGILREWEKKGIHTRLEVEKEDMLFQARQNKKTIKQRKTATGSKSKYDNIYL